VPIVGDPLVPTAPRGPGQQTLHALLGRQPETPEEPTPRADPQRHHRPREALQTVRRLPAAPGDLLLHGGAVGRGAARRTGHRAYAPLAHVLADPSPSPAGRPPAPARPLLGPPPSTVRWASGGRPPGPRLPGASAPGHPRRTRCALSGRADADGPRATTARGAAMAPPMGATARPTPGGLGARHPPAPATRLPPPTSPGALGPAPGGRPARPRRAPRRCGPPPGGARPTTPAAVAAPRTPSPRPPRRPARPRPTPAPAAAGPAVAWGHRRAQAVPARAPRPTAAVPTGGRDPGPLPPDVALRARLGHQPPHGARRHAPCRPALWPCAPGRRRAVREPPRLLTHEPRGRSAQRLDPLVLQL